MTIAKYVISSLCYELVGIRVEAIMAISINHVSVHADDLEETAAHRERPTICSRRPPNPGGRLAEPTSTNGSKRCCERTQ
jgi:hypothetical protein